MGGTILTYPSWEWHIISLTRADDPDRAPRFEQAAAEFGAQAYISDLDDSSPTLAPLSDDLEEIKARISEVVSRAPRSETFDLIFTHGRNGEYGHERHIQVHRAVYEMIEYGDLSGNLTLFDYVQMDPGICTARLGPGSRCYMRLTADEFHQKQHVIRDIYGFQPGSFEFDSTGMAEAFSGPGARVLKSIGSRLTSTETTTQTKGG